MDNSNEQPVLTLDQILTEVAEETLHGITSPSGEIAFSDDEKTSLAFDENGLDIDWYCDQEDGSDKISGFTIRELAVFNWGGDVEDEEGYKWMIEEILREDFGLEVSFVGNPELVNPAGEWKFTVKLSVPLAYESLSL